MHIFQKAVTVVILSYSQKTFREIAVFSCRMRVEGGKAALVRSLRNNLPDDTAFRLLFWIGRGGRVLHEIF